MKVLITGAKGQLGFELLRLKPIDWEVHAHDIDELDITSFAAVQEFLDLCQPALIINAAAYTAVDRAESESEMAFLVNAEGAKNLAIGARESGARIIQVSTDFVFDGRQSRPYRPEDPTAPLGVYGHSKLLGEQYVRKEHPEGSMVIRTSWLYSAHGNNFVKTMLRLMQQQQQQQQQIRVVVDQIGTPTWARTLAGAIWSIALKPRAKGTFHWTDLGVASWYDFAVAILEEGLEIGLLHQSVPIRPIPTSEYPTPAKRPSFSVLETFSTRQELGLSNVYWREALRQMLRELAAASASH